MSYTPAIGREILAHRHYTLGPLDPISVSVGITTGQSYASAAWPNANTAIYIPIYIAEAVTVYEAGIGTGATAGGNFDIGIYQMDGTKVVSSGATARTASAWNVAGLADTELTPGWYYAAMSADSTANYSGIAPAAGLCEAMGVCSQDTAYVLPSPATPGRTTRALIPGFCFAVRSLAL